MCKIGKVFLFVQIVYAGMGFVYSVAEARNRVSGDTVYIKRVHVRTWRAMEAAEADMKASGKVPEMLVIPFRTTMSEDAYKAAKEVAASAGVSRQDIEAVNEVATAPVFIGPDIEGVNQIQAGGARPPDTHGAVGIDHFVEVTNSHIDIYEKSTGNSVKSISLAGFFGYDERVLFDPRCVYDSVAKRWLVTAEAMPEDMNVQFYFLAVSKTSNPTDTFYIFNFDANYKNNNDFFDYPQLGVDRNAVLITANIFSHFEEPEMSFIGADVYVIDKAKLYKGSGVLRSKRFAGLGGPNGGTIAPPIVSVGIDSKIYNTVLVSAKAQGDKLTLYTLTYPGGIPKLSESTITVNQYWIPPPAQQPYTDAKLDTMDSRFPNASTQIGSSLWQVHTIRPTANFPVPRPRFYEIDTVNKKVIQYG
jgi:hypothetical protein